MALTSLNLPRIIDELKQVIDALDILGGLVKHEPPLERCPYPLPYAPEVFECPTDPETFRSFMFEYSWRKLTSSVVHLKNVLNNGQVDSLDCNYLTRRQLGKVWALISNIPTGKPAILPIDREPALENVACNVGSLLRHCLANLTGRPVPSWIEGETWEPDVSPHGRSLKFPESQSVRTAVKGKRKPGRQAATEAAVCLAEVTIGTMQGTDEQRQLDTAKSPTGHSTDFRSVRWYGASHDFTATQAACIKVLWENWKNGTPGVGEQTILEAADSSQRRLINVFNSGNHSAWNNMIRPGSTKGTFRLAKPD